MHARMTAAEKRRLPRPATVLAVIALIAALGGSAIALPGRQTVDGNDLRDGVVKSRHIARDAVKAKHLATERFHPVGASGEPSFADGGDGDCVWGNSDLGISPAGSGFNPASFHKDPLGIVHLAGVVEGADGPGGDGTCAPGSADAGDSVVFILPAGYRPENVEFHPSADGILVIPAGGATLAGLTFPAGAVVTLDGQTLRALLDGITFRAAGAATAPIDNPLGPAGRGGASGLGRLLPR